MTSRAVTGPAVVTSSARPAGADGGHLPAGEDLAAAGPDLVCVGERDAPEVDDAGPRASGAPGSRPRAARAPGARLRPIARRPSTPFSAPRRSSSASRGSSDSSSATTTLPHARTGCRARRRTLDLGLALAAEPRLQRAGPVVEPRVEDARVVPDWCVASSGSFSSTARGDGGMAVVLLTRLLDGFPVDALAVELATKLVVRESTAPVF